jgi:hypothetical protein
MKPLFCDIDSLYKCLDSEFEADAVPRVLLVYFPVSFFEFIKFGHRLATPVNKVLNDDEKLVFYLNAFVRHDNKVSLKKYI